MPFPIAVSHLLQALDSDPRTKRVIGGQARLKDFKKTVREVAGPDQELSFRDMFKKVGGGEGWQAFDVDQMDLIQQLANGQAPKQLRFRPTTAQEITALERELKAAIKQHLKPQRVATGESFDYRDGKDGVRTVVYSDKYTRASAKSLPEELRPFYLASIECFQVDNYPKTDEIAAHWIDEPLRLAAVELKKVIKLLYPSPDHPRGSPQDVEDLVNENRPGYDGPVIAKMARMLFERL